MKYYVDRNSSDYRGKRVYDTLSKALTACQDWVLSTSGRTAEIKRGHSLGTLIYRYWTDRYGMQYMRY